MAVSDKDGIIVLGDSPTLSNNITIKTPTTPDGSLEFYKGVPGNLGQLLFKDQDVNGSGRIVQIKTEYQTGYTSSSTSPIAFSNNTVQFTPRSANSTIYCIFTFNAITPVVSGVNATAFFFAYDITNSIAGSTWEYSATTSTGGIGSKSAGVAMLQLDNYSLSTRGLQLRGYRASDGSYAISAGGIHHMMIEYQN